MWTWYSELGILLGELEYTRSMFSRLPSRVNSNAMKLCTRSPDLPFEISTLELDRESLSFGSMLWIFMSVVIWQYMPAQGT